MVRREILNFNLVTDFGTYPCRLPASVSEVLSSAEAEFGSIGFARFETEFNMDEAALSSRYFYLRLSGVYHPAEIYVGDSRIGFCDGRAAICNFDVKPFAVKGKNILSIRFVGSSESLLHAGISSPCQLLRFSGAIIDRVSLTQKHTDTGVTVGIKLSMLGNESGVRAVATIVSSAGQIYYGGLTKGEGSITISDPLYWWPKGFGVQNLYRLSVSLYGDLDIEDSLEERIGLRRILADGELLEVGGHRLLPMGAVYLADAVSDRSANEKKLEAYVTSAAMCGFNTLVLPKDSPIPPEKFYDLCDVHGIMVIEQHSAVGEGDADALRRRAHHACLALVELIGGEEAEETAEMLKILLPDLSVRVRESAPRYVASNALPSMKSIRAQIPEGERTLFSYSMENIAEEGAIRDMLLSVAERYPYPRSLSDFAYASALASANRVGEAVKLSRLSPEKHGRAIFDRLGDRDLAISSSSIDHRARWKPLQYYSKRHFSPVKLYADYEDGYVMFSAVSAKRKDVSATLEYKIADSQNNTIHSGVEHAEIPSLASTRISSMNLTSYVQGRERDCYLEYSLKDGSSILSSGILLFVPEKHFEFKKPKITARIVGEGRKFSIALSSDVFVKDLEIDFDGVDALLSDNYIDLTSPSPIRLDVNLTSGSETAESLQSALQLRSVYDLK